jgi:hypothetical protein
MCFCPYFPCWTDFGEGPCRSVRNPAWHLPCFVTVGTVKAILCLQTYMKFCPYFLHILSNLDQIWCRWFQRKSCTDYDCGKN